MIADFNVIDFLIATVGAILFVGGPMFLLIRNDAKEKTREEWQNRLALASEIPPAESWEEVKQRKLKRSASHGRTDALKDTPILSMTTDQLFQDVMGLNLEDITRPGYPIEYPIHVFMHYLQAFFIVSKKMDERIKELEGFIMPPEMPPEMDTGPTDKQRLLWYTELKKIGYTSEYIDTSSNCE